MRFLRFSAARITARVMRNAPDKHHAYCSQIMGSIELATANFEPPAVATNAARAAAGRADAERKKIEREALKAAGGAVAAGAAKPKGKGPKPAKSAQQKKEEGANGAIPGHGLSQDPRGVGSAALQPGGLHSCFTSWA